MTGTTKKYVFPIAASRWTVLLTVRKFIENPFSVLDNALARYGKTYTFFMGGIQKAILTVDPEVIRQLLQKHHRVYEKSPIVTQMLGRYLGKGLLTSTGEFWLRQRRLIQPGFHRKRIDALRDLMELEISERMKSWRAMATHQGVVDAYEEMHSLTFSIIARTLFSLPLEESGLEKLSSLISTLQHFIVREVRQPYKRWWFRWSGQTRHHKNLADEAREMIRNVIQERMAGDQQYDDLLSILMESRYEDTGLPMEIEQLIDECMILFVAGHETSANALSWMLYLLGSHREILEEIQKSDGERRSLLIREVMQETLRLYPPAWVVDRISLQDDEIDGYHLPKGTIWIVYIRGMHRHKDFWPQPDRFWPERWSASDVAKEAWMPFGLGPRLCIGEHFAMMEMEMVLAAILEEVDFTLLSDQVGEKPLVTLRPADPVFIRLEANN